MKFTSQASPETHINKQTPPLGFFHGTEDMLVSLDGSISPLTLHKKAKRMGISTEFKKIRTVGHFEAVYHPEATRFTIYFLEKYLLKH